MVILRGIYHNPPQIATLSFGKFAMTVCHPKGLTRDDVIARLIYYHKFSYLIPLVLKTHEKSQPLLQIH